MNKGFLTIPIIIGIVVISMLGVGTAVFLNQETPEEVEIDSDKESVATTTPNISTTTPDAEVESELESVVEDDRENKEEVFIESEMEEVAEIVEEEESLEKEYTEYIGDLGTQVIEEEHGLPVTGEITTPTEENSQGLWIISIPINSINGDLFLLPGKNETPWMDPVRFDKELTELETFQQANLASTTENWQQIVAYIPVGQQMINQIRQVYMPEWQLSQEYQKVSLSWAESQLSKIADEYGEGSEKIPEKYLPIYQHYVDLSLISEALVDIIDLNLQAKEETIKAVQNMNADAAVVAANDEDRLALVRLWHDERFFELVAEENILTPLIKEMGLPSLE